MSENPEEKLKQLQADLQKKENELGDVAKERDTLKGAIAALEKIVGDVKQILNAYKQALQGIQKEKDDISNYSNIKGSMIEAAIKDKKGAVEAAIKKIDDLIKLKDEEVKMLKNSLAAAKTDCDKAKESLKENQGAYDSLKALQKKISENLKDLKNLKDTIEKEEDKNKTANMYFLFLELNKLLKETEGALKSEGEFESEIYKAATELETAMSALREKDEQLKIFQAQLETKEKELESVKKTRRQDILAETEKL